MPPLEDSTLVVAEAAAILTHSLLILLTSTASPAEAPRCTYDGTRWSTVERRGVPQLPVDKPRDALGPEEIGPLGCTVCREDQVTVELANDLALTLCARIAEPVRGVLDRALGLGFSIETVQGYRPSMSRGAPDADGLRTTWSNHAYGTAVDVNAGHNGLYGDCTEWGPGCRLLVGGPWNPADPLSLNAGHPLVWAMEEIGLKWGGVLEGAQKDFMHFSPLGD